MTNLQQVNEDWRDLPKYVGYYQVSNLGKVRSVPRTYITGRGTPRLISQKIMATRLDRYGYEQIKLSKDGVSKRTTIHQLVAQAFLTAFATQDQVNHIDGVKTNNHVENLEWCTAMQNVRHSVETGLKGKRSGKMSYKPIQEQRRIRVIQKNLDGSEVREWESVSLACLTLGFKGVHHIGLCCKGKKSQYQGFLWEYKSAEEALSTLAKFKCGRGKTE